MPSEPSSDSALQEPLLLHSDEEPSTSGRQAPEPLAVRHASPVQALTSRLQALLRYVISRWSDFLRLVRDAYRRLAELGTGPRSLQLSRVQQDRLQDLVARAATPFSLEDPVHRGALLELWRLAFGCEFGSTADDTSGDFADGTAAAASGNESSGVANSGGNSAYGTAGGSIKHRRWRDLGWQQDDPTTDFRAAGFFGLHNLLHLATRHPQAFTTLMLKSNGTRADFEYPFAAAGINLTVMLLEVIGLSGAVRDEKGRRSGAAGASAPLRMAQATQPAPAPAATSGLQASKPAAMNVAGNAAGGAAAGAAAGQGEAPPLQLKSTPAARGYVRLMTNYSSGHEAFEELYCVSFQVLDATWLERKASYMQFNEVLTATRERLVASLAAQPASMAELRRSLGL